MKRTRINHLRPHTCAGQLESPRSDSPAHDDGASILGHRLQTPWTFWFSRKDRRRSNSITAGPSGTVVIDKKLDKKEHMEHLVQIGTCRTVEEFWQCATALSLSLSLALFSLLSSCLRFDSFPPPSPRPSATMPSSSGPAICRRRATCTSSGTSSSPCGR